MSRTLQTLKEKWPEYILEVVVIVFSIVLAFWLSSWDEDRREKRAASYYLEEMSSNLDADILHMKEVIASQSERYNYMHEFLTLSSTATADDITTLEELYSKAHGSNNTFFPTKGAYHAMIAERSLHLLENKALVTQLVDLYERDYDRLIYTGETLDMRVDRVILDWIGKYSRPNGKFVSFAAATNEQTVGFLEYEASFLKVVYLAQAEATLMKMEAIQSSIHAEL